MSIMFNGCGYNYLVSILCIMWFMCLFVLVWYVVGFYCFVVGCVVCCV